MGMKKEKRKQEESTYAMDGDHASSEFNTDGEIMNRLESFVSELQEQA
jgi:hypothetical protein